MMNLDINFVVEKIMMMGVRKMYAFTLVLSIKTIIFALLEPDGRKFLATIAIT